MDVEESQVVKKEGSRSWRWVHTQRMGAGEVTPSWDTLTTERREGRGGREEEGMDIYVYR